MRCRVSIVNMTAPTHVRVVRVAPGIWEVQHDYVAPGWNSGQWFDSTERAEQYAADVRNEFEPASRWRV